MKMKRLLYPVLLLWLSACKRQECAIHYKYLGEVGSRTSYLGVENWTKAEFDSVQNSNPSIGGLGSDRQALDSLKKAGLANEKELFLEKIRRNTRDTIYIANSKSCTDTVYLSFDSRRSQGSIIIRNGHAIDSLPIDDQIFSHTFSLIRPEEASSRLIILVNQYYFMNGDNYMVSLYGKQ